MAAFSLTIMCLHRLTSMAAVFSILMLDTLWGGRGALAEIVVKDLHSNETASIFPDMQGSFGDDFPLHGLEGRVVFTNPRTACDEITPAPVIADHCMIALILRGDCEFTTKVLNAQKANFCSAIIYNYRGKQGLTRMGGGSSEVKIPSTFVGYDNGMELGTRYNYKDREYIIHIQEVQEVDYRMYLWPFAIVVGVCFLIIMLFLLIKFVRDHTRTRVARLSKKHLKKIPIRKFKKGQYYDTCAICLDEYEDGEKIRVLPCDHAYHAKCIDPWLTRNKKTCPVCKRRVIPGKDPNSEDSDSDSDRGGNSSQTTPLLLNASQRSHGSVNHVQNEIVPVARAQSAPAMFEAAVVIEEEGAVGGVGLSAIPDNQPMDGTRGKELDRGEQREGRRKRRERREEPIDGGAALDVDEESEQRKAERRERRKKRKEKKKREERRSKHSSAEGGEEGESSRLVEEKDEDYAGGSSLRPEGAEGGHAGQLEEPSGYVNPNFMESPEVVPASGRGRKRELSEVV